MKTHNTKKAVILLSGGMDSATCLVHTKAQGFDCYALSFNYNQLSAAEVKAAQNVAKFVGAVEHKIVALDIGTLLASALTVREITIPHEISNDTIPVTYVPARNTIFLSIALGWAEVIGARNIFYGANHIDYSGYPDCRPDYIAAFQTVANLATKAGREGDCFTIEAPLINLSKAEIIKLGDKLGLDYSLTVSCYDADEHGLACGLCASCQLRAEGFKAAGIPDSTRYKVKNAG